MTEGRRTDQSKSDQQTDTRTGASYPNCIHPLFPAPTAMMPKSFLKRMSLGAQIPFLNGAGLNLVKNQSFSLKVNKISSLLLTAWRSLLSCTCSGKRAFKQSLYSILKINLNLENITQCPQQNTEELLCEEALPQLEQQLGFHLSIICSNAKVNFSLRKMRSCFTERNHCFQIHMTSKHKTNIMKVFIDVG